MEQNLKYIHPVDGERQLYDTLSRRFNVNYYSGDDLMKVLLNQRMISLPRDNWTVFVNISNDFVAYNHLTEHSIKFTKNDTVPLRKFKRTIFFLR